MLQRNGSSRRAALRAITLQKCRPRASRRFGSRQRLAWFTRTLVQTLTLTLDFALTLTLASTQTLTLTLTRLAWLARMVAPDLVVPHPETSTSSGLVEPSSLTTYR